MRRLAQRQSQLLPQFGTAVVALFGTLTASAQQSAPRFAIVPSATITETITDNYNPGVGAPQSDAISQIGVGLHLTSGWRVLDGGVDLGLTRSIYARHPEKSHSEQSNQQKLNARLRSEFADKQGTISATASISRQAVSAFGVQSADAALINANTTQVRSLEVAPSWRGQIAGLWSYLASATYTTMHTGSGQVGNSSAGTSSLQLDRARQGRLSWSLLLQRSVNRYTATPHTSSGRAQLSANADVPEADLKLTANAGYEHSNLTTSDDAGGKTWGGGAVWTPSPRTRLNAQYEKRQFGDTRSANFEFRTARTVWNFTSSLGVASNAPASRTTFFDLYYAVFASAEPDPVKRTQLVNKFLQDNGISPSGAIPGSFLPRSTTFSNQHTLSFALQGVRSGLTASATSSESWQANASSALGGDLANGQHVYQNGLSLNLSHRLTPQSSLNLIGTVSDSHGSLSSGASSKLRTLNLSWSGELSRRVVATAALRHSNFANDTAPYRENAAIATLTFRY